MRTNEESYNKNITDVSKQDILLVPFLLLNFTKSSICLKYTLGKSIYCFIFLKIVFIPNNFYYKYSLLGFPSSL